MPIDRLEDLGETFAPLPIEISNRATQPRDRGRQFIPVFVNRGDPLLDLRGFRVSTEIDRTHFVTFLEKSLQPRLGLIFDLGRDVSGRIRQNRVGAQAIQNAFGQICPIEVGLLGAASASEAAAVASLNVWAAWR
jgi:hypothetical protein